MGRYRSRSPSRPSAPHSTRPVDQNDRHTAWFVRAERCQAALLVDHPSALQEAFQLLLPDWGFGQRVGQGRRRFDFERNGSVVDHDRAGPDEASSLGTRVCGPPQLPPGVVDEEKRGHRDFCPRLDEVLEALPWVERDRPGSKGRADARPAVAGYQPGHLQFRYRHEVGELAAPPAQARRVELHVEGTEGQVEGARPGARPTAPSFDLNPSVIPRL